jgi:hypothetical protein
MGKARIYSKGAAYTPNNRRDLRHIRKAQRNQVRAMPCLVAGRERTADHGEKSREQ